MGKTLFMPMNSSTRRSSELRILEILDGICDAVSEYELAGVHTDHTAGSQSTWQWLPPKSKKLSNSTRLGKSQLKQQQRRLQNDCARLIDKAEDDLTAALQKGSSSADIQTMLCTDCRPASEQSAPQTEL
ncbi:hypothetical protein ABBQ32_000032 [Trebouxia sp. C0010 RCD-2024]